MRDGVTSRHSMYAFPWYTRSGQAPDAAGAASQVGPEEQETRSTAASAVVARLAWDMGASPTRAYAAVGPDLDGTTWRPGRETVRSAQGSDQRRPRRSRRVEGAAANTGCGGTGASSSGRSLTGAGPRTKESGSR